MTLTTTPRTPCARCATLAPCVFFEPVRAVPGSRSDSWLCAACVMLTCWECGCDHPDVLGRPVNVFHPSICHACFVAVYPDQARITPPDRVA